MSLARRHFEATMAKAAASAAAPADGKSAPAMPETGAAAGEYQQLLIALGDDLRQLQKIQSIERKIEAKRHMIARYLPWIEGALSREVAVQDEIVAQMLVWSIDIADWPLALRLAGHVVRHGLALPERYKRSAPAMIAEEVAEAGLKKPPQVDLATLAAVADLTAGADMHDQIRAKLAKATGLALADQAEAFDPEAESAPAGGKAALIYGALTYFRRALELDKASGVKKLIEQLEREQKKPSPPADPAGAFA